MRRLFLLAALLLFFTAPGNAQYVVTGVAIDTLNSLPVVFSSVVVIRSSDSVIESFGRTDFDGRVSLKVSRKGKYIIRASAPNFVDYKDEVEVKDSATNIGTMIMVTKARLLKEFVFTQQIAAIKVKGDTTEYVADSFHTRENASVEDLLKKLPGIQVDKNGKITAQGEEVKKILVDGEEFFSDDPKVVTQGLAANALNKVQVYDKKSDQAEFTGIDDGQKIKTINLELKDDKKKGFFGKADAGGGTDGYFQNQGMINAFKAKKQLSAFGIVSNTEKAGLSWNDNEKFGGGGNTSITEDGGVVTYYNSSEDDISGWGGRYSGEGLPKTWTGGVHYADKWSEDKKHLSLNYRYAKQNLEVDGQTTVNNPLYVQTTKKNQFSTGDRNVVGGIFEWKLDSLTTLKLSVDGGNKTLSTLSHFNTQTTNPEGGRQNENDRTTTSNSKGEFMNSSVLLRKKFMKKGRTFSLDVRENYRDAIADGTITSVVNYATSHSTGGFDSSAHIDQYKNNTSNSMVLQANVSYTEPLSKASFLVGNYEVVSKDSRSANLSYNESAGRPLEFVDSGFSSDFQYNVLVNKGGLAYRYVNKGESKLTFSAGTDVANTSFEQADKYHTDKGVKTSYINFFPSASIDYALKKQTSVSLYYEGNTRQPTITEVQTLKQNIDPLNQTIGNPNLKQEFSNNVHIRFNDYKALTNQYTWLNMSFGNTLNAISTQQDITSQGTTTTYVNVDGNYNASLWCGGGVKVKKTIMYVNGSIGSSLYHYISYIDGQQNVSDNKSISFNPSLDFDKESKYELEFSPGISYNDNRSTISKYNNSYWMMESEFSGTFELPKKFSVGTSVNFYIRQKTPVFTQNNNVTRWNAHIGKKFGKKKQLETRLLVNDILNQNLGYNRQVMGGIVTETRYNTIRRYGMLNIIWNFTHTPGSTAAANNENDD